jgi:hypothetical protein
VVLVAAHFRVNPEALVTRQTLRHLKEVMVAPVLDRNLIVFLVVAAAHLKQAIRLVQEKAAMEQHLLYLEHQ